MVLFNMFHDVAMYDPTQYNTITFNDRKWEIHVVEIHIKAT